jgi:hypothetical protein
MTNEEHRATAERLLSDASFQRSDVDPTPVCRDGQPIKLWAHASLLAVGPEVEQ